MSDSLLKATSDQFINYDIIFDSGISLKEGITILYLSFIFLKYQRQNASNNTEFFLQ